MLAENALRFLFIYRKLCLEDWFWSGQEHHPWACEIIGDVTYLLSGDWNIISFGFGSTCVN